MAWIFDPRDFAANRTVAFFANNGGTGAWLHRSVYAWMEAQVRWLAAQGWMVFSEEIIDPPEDEAPRTPPRTEPLTEGKRRQLERLLCHEELDIA